MTICPVIHPESSEAKKTAALEMSSGCAILPKGVPASVSFRPSLSAIPALRTPSVSTMPGFKEFTRIFFGPSSLDSETVIASTAALVPL